MGKTSVVLIKSKLSLWDLRLVQLNICSAHLLKSRSKIGLRYSNPQKERKI